MTASLLVTNTFHISLLSLRFDDPNIFITFLLLSKLYSNLLMPFTIRAPNSSQLPRLMRTCTSSVGTECDFKPIVEILIVQNLSTADECIVISLCRCFWKFGFACFIASKESVQNEWMTNWNEWMTRRRMKVTGNFITANSYLRTTSVRSTALTKSQ